MSKKRKYLNILKVATFFCICGVTSINGQNGIKVIESNDASSIIHLADIERMNVRILFDQEPRDTVFQIDLINGDVIEFDIDKFKVAQFGNYNSTALKEAENPISEKNIRVFPNPAKSEVFIRLKDAASNNISVNVYNMQGKLIVSNKNPEFTEKELIRIDTSVLPTGVYFITVKNEIIEYSQKLIIQ